MEGGANHLNVSYSSLIFHAGFTVDLKRFRNLMSIGLHFRLSHSNLQRFKISPHNIFPERNTDFKMNVPSKFI